MQRIRLDRRRFLSITGSAAFGAGLILAMNWDNTLTADSIRSKGDKNFRPNAWLKIGTDGHVVVYTVESEMGQGPYTLMPMILAEELDVDWRDVGVLHAPVTHEYGFQLTGGSSSIRKGWGTLRGAGAAAREMLITAAAKQWRVPRKDCHASDSHIVNGPTNERLSYGELALAAATLPLPRTVHLKTPDEYRILGTPVPRLDVPEKVNGSAKYGIDMDLPEMLYATTVHCPVLGGRPGHVEDEAALRIDGMHSVFVIDGAVAVVATDTWTAFTGARKIQVHWDKDSNTRLDSDSIRVQLEKAAGGSGKIETRRGNVARALKTASVVNASYELPFEAHAPMEPMNCTARVLDGRWEVWVPTQSPSRAQETVRQYGQSSIGQDIKDMIPGEAENSVQVHTTLLGGGFGRRLEQDYVAEAVQIAKEIGRPVKLTWTREQDMQHDFYHPQTFHILDGGVDDKGLPVAWWHRIAGVGTPHAAPFPYAIPNVRIEVMPVDVPVPTGAWRSVSHHYYAFAQETFFDELAHLGRRDPLELRLQLLRDRRLRAVLELAADKAGWAEKRPAGHFLGVAAHFSFGTYVAEIVEVAIGDTNQVHVPRVVVAVDCGIIINPDIVAAQMESSVVFALQAAVKGSITLKDGRVQQSNYDDFPIVRLDEMPKVETFLVKNAESPQGIGEPGVPPCAPALANALLAATGKPVRSLPIRAGTSSSST